MEQNKQLSIVIPTYNRADFLDYSLEVHIPLLEKYNIQIFISDNASTDNTREIVSKWMKEYKFLSYYQNETNIGPDANFEKALKLPDTEYIWLLSDTYQIPDDGISYLLSTIEKSGQD
ncbi:MAG: glycosyltransferase family 2 protein [Campylobacteraceae bacterium]|nr:glycosyltransferase family 2 protein [Campylobacteraceae bacterium]